MKFRLKKKTQKINLQTYNRTNKSALANSMQNNFKLAMKTGSKALSF